jgi:hypothetical protein
VALELEKSTSVGLGYESQIPVRYSIEKMFCMNSRRGVDGIRLKMEVYKPKIVDGEKQDVNNQVLDLLTQFMLFIEPRSKTQFVHSRQGKRQGK